MSRALLSANAVVAFLIELLALAGLAYGGAHAGGVLLAIALPAVAIVLWALFAAPRARIKVPLAGQLAVKALVFGGAALALIASGHPLLGVLFALVAAANTAIGTVAQARGFEFGR